MTINPDQPPRIPSADPSDYPSYGAWFEALQVRRDLEMQAKRKEQAP